MKKIHLYACDGNIDGLREEIQIKGIDVNCREKKDSETPLHYAAANGRSEAVKFLLENGADLYARNELLDTPLQVAVARIRMRENEKRSPEYFKVFELLFHHEIMIRKNDVKMYQNIPLLKDIKNSNEFTPVTWLNSRPQIQQKLLEIIAQVVQEQNEIARQEEASRNIQPPARLMPDSIPSESSVSLRHRPTASSAAKEKTTDAAQPVNADSHVKIDLSPRSWWNNVMSFLYSEKARDELQQPLLAERKVSPDSPTTPKHVKVQ